MFHQEEHFFTIIPISSLEKWGTKAGYEDHRETLAIYSTWGTPYAIQAEWEILEKIIKECKGKGLTRRGHKTNLLYTSKIPEI